MASDTFPTKTYIASVVRLLDIIEYKDNNFTPQARIDFLHYSYNEAANHFAQPRVRNAFKISDAKLEQALMTITAMVVYCWVDVTRELMAALTIHYTYALILDDMDDDPQNTMSTYFDDLVAGRPQQHIWWKLVNEQLPNVLDHYGPYCALNTYRSTVDFFEGCWIEQHNFSGYPGATDYPEFLRRMNGLGHAVSATLWPKNLFDEEKYFCEITTCIAMLENWMIWVNDTISYYKEFDEPRDQAGLVNNYCAVGGLTHAEGMEKLTNNVLRVSEQIKAVFKDKDPRIAETISKFMHGHLTWHLCDKRYRMNEVFDLAGDDEVGTRFRRYYQEAQGVGRVDKADWVYTDAPISLEAAPVVPAKRSGDLGILNRAATLLRAWIGRSPK